MTLLVTMASPMLYKSYRSSSWDSILASGKYPKQSRNPSLKSSQGFQSLRQNLQASVSKTYSLTGSKASTKQYCRPRRYKLILRPPLNREYECRPLIVHTWGCHGYCPSYSQIDPRNTTNIRHNCKCCQVTRVVRYNLSISCELGPNIPTVVAKPLGCVCRPCYADSSYRQILKIDDLLRTKTAARTPQPYG